MALTLYGGRARGIAQAHRREYPRLWDSLNFQAARTHRHILSGGTLGDLNPNVDLGINRDFNSYSFWP